MRNKCWIFGLLFVLAAAVPTVSLAQQTSVDTPDDKALDATFCTAALCAPNTSENVPGSVANAPRTEAVTVRFMKGGVPFLFSAISTERACDRGSAVANNFANAICKKAVALSWNVGRTTYQTAAACDAAFPLNPVAGLVGTCQDSALASSGPFIVADPSITPNCGFQVTYEPTNNGGVLPRVKFDDDQSCHMVGLLRYTGAGNSVILDLKRQYILQIQANGAERSCVGPNQANLGTVCTSNSGLCTGGNVCTDTIVRVKYRPIGGSVATLAPVNLTSFIGNPTGLMNALKDQLQAQFGDPGTVAVLTSFSSSQFSGSYASGIPILRALDYNGFLSDIGIEVVQGGNSSSFQIAQETSEFNAASTPAMNPWGAAALVAAILLSSLWFLRRRVLLTRG